jgi:hypothetical protein
MQNRIYFGGPFADDTSRLIALINDLTVKSYLRLLRDIQNCSQLSHSCHSAYLNENTLNFLRYHFSDPNFQDNILLQLQNLKMFRDFDRHLERFESLAAMVNFKQQTFGAWLMHGLTYHCGNQMSSISIKDFYFVTNIAQSTHLKLEQNAGINSATNWRMRQSIRNRSQAISP